MLARGFPSGLTSLSVKSKDCEHITDEGLKALARILPSGRTNPSVNLNDGKSITAEDLKLRDVFRYNYASAAEASATRSTITLHPGK